MNPHHAHSLGPHGGTVQEVPVLIVGGGPVGLTASILLSREGVRSLLVEGGATLAAALVQDALVDRLVIFRAPLVLGAGSLNAFGTAAAVRAADAPRWRLVESRRFGDDEMTVYAPPR